MPDNRKPPGRFEKRVVDLGVALGALLLLWPFLLLLAALIKLTSSGSVFFRQKRVGLDGRLFTILKFRTMVMDASDLRSPDGSALTSASDPRVTPIGRILRSRSLDELPQLFNVIRGEMSLVGPRPDPPAFLHLYRKDDYLRLCVKPGLTGWAVIHGRNEISWEQRRDLDIEYVKRASFLLDMKILLVTIPYVLTGKGVNRSRTQ